jgi:lia operon protein LiaI
MNEIMQTSSKGGFALLLIGCGALILLSKLGFLFHGLFGLLFPVALMYLGFIGIKQGRSFIGWVLLGIGTFALMCKLSGLIAILVAAGFIYYGITLLKNNNRIESEV